MRIRGEEGGNGLKPGWGHLNVVIEEDKYGALGLRDRPVLGTAFAGEGFTDLTTVYPFTLGILLS
jgi:hypothetical protein